MAGSGGKAAVRLAIQKEVFTAAEERLLGLSAVTKPGRKKKISYLCVSVNPQEKPPQVYVSRIKQDDQRKEKQSYRRVRKWELGELKMIDGKSADAEVPEFDLHFDKSTFKWVASSVAEKKAFIVCLYKMVHKYLSHNKPEFVHVDEERLHELLATAEAGGRGREIEEEAVQQEEYQELTEKEQEDLERLLKEEEEKNGDRSVSGIQDIEAFTEHLSQQLAQLDEANIHTLMDSETQIHSLMLMIDKAMLEIQQTETKLAIYDELLSSVRGSMSKLSKDYTRINVWDRNLKALLAQVEDIVEKLYLDPRVEKILRSSQLNGDHNIRECTNAVKDLHHVMSQQLSQGVQIMQAVSDQKKYFSELSFEFGRRLQEHLCTAFTQKATLMTEVVTQRQSGMPSLSSHGPVHNDFRQYTELMHWLKDCENQRFVEVCEAYCVEFQKVYDNEIKAFMADVKSLLGRGSDIRKGNIVGSGLLKHGGSQADIRGGNLGSPALRGLSTSLMDFSQSPNRMSGVLEPDKPRFDQVFMLVLDQLQPLCSAEQKFCNTFFHIPKLSPPTSQGVSPVPPKDEGQEETDGLLDVLGLMTKKQQRTTIDVGIMGGGVKGLLQTLFDCLLSELKTLIEFGEKIDSYNSLQLLVAVSQRVLLSQEGGEFSYLDDCLANSLLVLKRLFDNFVDTKKRSILECKVPRKGGKCGILPCVTEFEQFAERAERIVMGTDRRMNLDKAYNELLTALFDTIERLADEHPKTPRNVVLFENYHKLYDVLSHLKIQCLENTREEAKQRSRVHQQEYVIACLGKPLDKLSTFFEGVERLLASGIKPEQIGFYRDYNKTELLKCIQHYPGKEVKKGLEKLYRRCERDVSEELGRLRVIWGAMQKAFIDQYEHFTKLMETCYPGSNIQLEFKLDDIIEYFRSISED